MRKSLRRLARCALVALTATGCARAARLGAGPGAHPVPLVGEWIDLAHTTRGDTALWVLQEDGDDLARHVVADSAGGGAGRVASTRRYGHWQLRGDLADTAARAICFSNRPGRSAPTCLAFSLDTLAVPARLAVLGYEGAHHAGTREFVRRQVP